MKVTLRKFLDIVGDDLLETYITYLYVDEWDELFEEWFPRKVMNGMKSVKELEPYTEYEITALLAKMDTSKLHYVKVPENHIVIDFDIRDESGQKSFHQTLSYDEIDKQEI